MTTNNVQLKPLTAKPLSVYGKKAKIVALPAYNIARFTDDEPLFRKALANLMFSHGWDNDSIIGVRHIINQSELQVLQDGLQAWRDKVSSGGEMKEVLATFTRDNVENPSLSVSVKLTREMYLAEFDTMYNVKNGIVPAFDDSVLIVFKGFQRTLATIAANAALRNSGGNNAVIGHILANTYDYLAFAKEQYPDLDGVELEAKAIEAYKLECGRENFIKNEGTSRIRGIDHFRNAMEIYRSHGQIAGFEAKLRPVMGVGAAQKVAAVKRLSVMHSVRWPQALGGESLEQAILKVDSKIAYDSLDRMTLISLANGEKRAGKESIKVPNDFETVKAYMLGETDSVKAYSMADVLPKLESSRSPALQALAKVIAQGNTQENNLKIVALCDMDELVNEAVEARANEILSGNIEVTKE